MGDFVFVCFILGHFYASHTPKHNVDKQEQGHMAIAAVSPQFLISWLDLAILSAVLASEREGMTDQGDTS